MKLFLDTAIYEEIEQAVTWGVIDGITTNPTLIAKAGKDHEEQVKRICQIIGNVSAEVVSEKKDDMIVEGRRLAAWHKNVIVKVPLTPDGLAAGKVLAGEGTRINVTLCFSVNQALLAGAIGAYIVSPFAGRLDDINETGCAWSRTSSPHTASRRSRRRCWLRPSATQCTSHRLRSPARTSRRCRSVC